MLPTRIKNLNRIFKFGFINNLHGKSKDQFISFLLIWHSENNLVLILSCSLISRIYIFAQFKYSLIDDASSLV